MSLSDSTATATGWILFVAAIGMMCTLMSADFIAMKSWEAIKTPFFIGTEMAHLGAVIAAFVGGVLIPPARSSHQTRAGDPPQQP